MSKEVRGPSLHIEWSPQRVQAVDTAHSRRGSGTRLSELSSVISGHREALIGVSRNLIFLKTVSLPKAAPEDLRRILGVQVGQLFPLPPSDVAFDFVQTNEAMGDGYLTMVAAMRADDLRQLRGDLQEAGISATRILPVALGAPAVAHHAGRGGDALVIEESVMGHTLDVVKDGVVRLSRTALNGSDLTGEAQRTLAAAGVGDLPRVAGGGEPLADATPTRYTALELLQEAPAAFTFELDEERVRAAQKRIALLTRISILMLLAAILLVAVIWVNRSDKEAVIKRGQGRWAAELTKLRSTQKTEIAKAQQATSMDKALQSAFEVAQPLADVVTLVGDALPRSAWLTGLSLERGKPLQIRGTASNPDDVAHYLEALSKSDRLRDVRLVVANTGRINETIVVQFNITATVVGNLPMPAPEKVKRTATKTTTTSQTAGAGASGGGAAAGTGAAK